MVEVPLVTMSPCFIPARLLGDADEHKVNVTRLGADRAQLSGDVPFELGDSPVLELNRPTDGSRVRVQVEITAVRREGQQWGWMPAIHVSFEQEIDLWLAVDGSTAPAQQPLPLPDATTSGEVISLDAPIASQEPGVHTLDDIMPPERVSTDTWQPVSGEDEHTVELPWEQTEEMESPPWEDYDPAAESPRERRKQPRHESRNKPVERTRTIEATESLSEGLDLPTRSGTPRRDSAVAPWSIPPGLSKEVIGREARILSEVTVSYLAAGQKRFATAQDFSRQGMFLAVANDDPLPKVGAVVRLGFPIELPDDLYVMRMTAEVRWVHGDDVARTAGRGAGLRICAFDTAAEQQFFEEYVKSLADNTPGPAAPRSQGTN